MLYFFNFFKVVRNNLVNESMAWIFYSCNSDKNANKLFFSDFTVNDYYLAYSYKLIL
jgi:hypothetical protein